MSTLKEEAELELSAFGRGRGRVVAMWVKQELMIPPSEGLTDCALRQDVGRRNCLASLLRMLESETPLDRPDDAPRLPEPGKPSGRATRGLRRRGQSDTIAP